MAGLIVLGLTAGCGDDDGSSSTPPRDAGADAAADADDAGEDTPEDVVVADVADAEADIEPDVESDADDGGVTPTDYDPADESGPWRPAEGFRVDVMWVDGFEPPENPETGAATPAQLNRTRVLRYRSDTDDPEPASAIVVAMPGFLGGAGSLHGLATAMLTTDPTIEFWAIDRRSNGLEDHRGMAVAAREGDPEIATRYYDGIDTIGGEPFLGFVSQEDASFASEWGLETHVEDVRRIIHLVPEEHRRQRVFLLGHSLGASFTEAYAGWEFADGTRGFEELAGIIVVDGSGGGSALDETAYMEGASGGVVPVMGLDQIRTETRYSTLPFLGLAVYVFMEVAALRTLHDPDGVVADAARDQTLGLLLATQVPPMTNEASLGFAFDGEFEPLAFVRVSLGKADGPVREYENPLAMTTLYQPSDPATTYGWIDAPEADPVEPTPVAFFAETLTLGPSNFAEWYFPTRLGLDMAACAGGAIPEDGWQVAQGLRCSDLAEADLPVLAVAGGLVSVPTMSSVGDRIATTVGAGRPAEGADRDGDGLVVIDATSLSHLDVVVSPSGPLNPVPPAVIDFVTANRVDGTVTVP